MKIVVNNIFLYLYPVKEFSKGFVYDDLYYEENNFRKPFDVLNETIQKRYRQNGYKIVFAIYPDKEIYGVIPKAGDIIINTDVTFNQAIVTDRTEEDKNNPVIYPNEKLILTQLGNVDNLVIGGYHAQDCVKRVGEAAIENGINTIVDLDLTDLFFNVYRQSEYFDEDYYNPEKFKQFIIHKYSRGDEMFAERIFNRNYESQAYGFSSISKKVK